MDVRVSISTSSFNLIGQLPDVTTVTGFLNISLELLKTKFADLIVDKVSYSIELDLILKLFMSLSSPPYTTLLSYNIAEARKVLNGLMWPQVA